MKVLDEFVVGIGTDFDSSGIDAAMSSFRGVRTGALGMGAGLAAATAAVAALAAAVAAVGAAAMASANYWAPLQRQAQNLRMPVDQLDKFIRGFDRLGVGAQDTIGYFEHIDKQIAELSVGGTFMEDIAAVAGNSFNLNVLNEQDHEKRNMMILQEFSKQSDKVKLMLAPILGISDDMRAVADKGSAAIEKSIAEVSKFTLNSPDIADGSQELLASMSDLGTAFASLRDAFGGPGVKRALTALITTIAEGVAILARFFDDVFNRSENFMDGLSKFGQGLIDFAKSANEMFRKFYLSIAQLVASFLGGKEAMDTVTTIINTLYDAADQFHQFLWDFITQILEFDFAQFFSDLFPSADEIQKAITDYLFGDGKNKEGLLSTPMSFLPEGGIDMGMDDLSKSLDDFADSFMSFFSGDEKKVVDPRFNNNDVRQSVADEEAAKGEAGSTSLDDIPLGRTRGGAPTVQQSVNVQLVINDRQTPNDEIQRQVGQAITDANRKAIEGLEKTSQ